MADRFPQEALLRDGRRVLLRLFNENDTGALYDFFQRLPGEIRRFAWDRIDNRSLIETWGRELDYAKVLPIPVGNLLSPTFDALGARAKRLWQRLVPEA